MYTENTQYFYLLKFTDIHAQNIAFNCYAPFSTSASHKFTFCRKCESLKCSHFKQQKFNAYLQDYSENVSNQSKLGKLPHIQVEPCYINVQAQLTSKAHTKNCNFRKVYKIRIPVARSSDIGGHRHHTEGHRRRLYVCSATYDNSLRELQELKPTIDSLTCAHARENSAILVEISPSSCNTETWKVAKSKGNKAMITIMLLQLRKRR